ncbi:MAG TPA: dTDP-4-dehydrorhamnose reductase, partial [Sphingomonadaceae bacterium]|nr:dTDP-4-dehydrorhamnose reductase [Sphingomonadaceae bacterium]
DSGRLRACLEAFSPDVVINSAAATDVDACEFDPAAAFRVNAAGAANLSAICRDIGARSFYVSTDYVFDGDGSRRFVETDQPNPVNVYGISKLAGELALLSPPSDGVVVRVGGLFGVHPCRGKGGRNFITSIAAAARTRDRVRVVDDEYVSPTCARDVARQIAAMIENEVPAGIYHATSQGECSWYDFAREIFARLGISVPLDRAASADMPAKAPRPSYCVLENRRLEAEGLDLMPNWQDALGRFLREEGSHLAG